MPAYCNTVRIECGTVGSEQGRVFIEVDSHYLRWA